MAGVGARGSARGGCAGQVQPRRWLTSFAASRQGLQGRGLQTPRKDPRLGRKGANGPRLALVKNLLLS